MVATSSAPVWDIFCKVVDNYGDAGVCWRVARQLHAEQGIHVRLWIDRLATLQVLRPGIDVTAPEQSMDGVEICDGSTIVPDPSGVDVVIEAFGCGLPEDYVAAMAGLARPPGWIVLDYLSAEAWVDSHHGLASPHPTLGLPRWYFYPGFTTSTGGLPREQDLLRRRDAIDAAARAGFWRHFGMTVPAPSVLTVSLFAYADAPVTDLLTAMAEDPRPTLLVVPAGAVVPAVQAFFGTTASTVRRGALELRLLPFLPQTQYDELLWACDLNMVRGEDSFVRAQWAGKPLIWQPYRQDDGAHQRKLQAFLQRYTAALNWSGELADLGEMSAKLVEFVRNKVK